jgi:hypothetical protein
MNSRTVIQSAGQKIPLASIVLNAVHHVEGDGVLDECVLPISCQIPRRTTIGTMPRNTRSLSRRLIARSWT